ncbi:MAG: hypothetical protein ACNA8W_19785 [Bradymonadaceae bacterium]
MRRSRESRWRDGRNTLPAKRRKRRAHRRDLPASRLYIPMEIDPQTAARGVKSRLLGALIAVMLTLGSILWGVSVAAVSMSATFAFIVGSVSLGAAIALLMSARREEEVHELASELNDMHGLFQDPEFVGYLNTDEHDGSL